MSHRFYSHVWSENICFTSTCFKCNSADFIDIQKRSWEPQNSEQKLVILLSVSITVRFVGFPRWEKTVWLCFKACSDVTHAFTNSIRASSNKTKSFAVWWMAWIHKQYSIIWKGSSIIAWYTHLVMSHSLPDEVQGSALKWSCQIWCVSWSRLYDCGAVKSVHCFILSWSRHDITSLAAFALRLIWWLCLFLYFTLFSFPSSASTWPASTTTPYSRPSVKSSRSSFHSCQRWRTFWTFSSLYVVSFYWHCLTT